MYENFNLSTSCQPYYYVFFIIAIVVSINDILFQFDLHFSDNQYCWVSFQLFLGHFCN